MRFTTSTAVIDFSSVLNLDTYDILNVKKID